MTAGRERTGTLTFLFTDLVRSAEMVGRLGDEPADELVSAKMRILSESVAPHGGAIVNTMGDTLFVVFENTLDALRCAVEMQRAVERDNAGHEPARRLDLGVGIHSGEAIARQGDYFGTPVIVAASLSGSARPGQIVVSGVTRALAGSRGGFAYRPLTPLSVKGMDQTIDVFEVVWRADEQGAVDAEGAPGSGRGRDESSVHSTVVILYVDVVDSTAVTQRIGDAAFRDRSHELDTKLRRAVRDGGGSAVEGRTLGDGVFALFPSARQALDTAFWCIDAASAVQLEVHVGVHAGDVMREGGNAYGGAVNLAARIADLTGPNEILVSSTVRDLARTSSDVVFEDRGEHALKGVDEPARVFSISQREAP
jgi:class 3 adenylate cyclase